MTDNPDLQARRMQAAFTAYTEKRLELAGKEGAAWDAVEAAIEAADAIDDRIFLSSAASDKINKATQQQMADLMSYGVSCVEINHIDLADISAASVQAPIDGA